MKIISIVSFLLLVSNTALWAQTSTKDSRAKATQLQAKAQLDEDPEIAEWKRLLADRSGAVPLKQKVHALVKLAEMSGDDITRFLSIRKAELEANMKSGSEPNNRDNMGFKSALNRVLSIRNTTESVASTE